MAPPDPKPDPRLPARRLGRNAPKDAPALRLSTFLRAVPEHPVAADHFTGVTAWGLWGNLRYGVCGPVALYNHVKTIAYGATGYEPHPSVEDVFGLYRLCNPDFDPATGAGDNGVVMQTMLEHALHRDVLGDGRMVAFAKVDLSSRAELRAAISIFGSVLLGVNLHWAHNKQTTEGLWDYVPGSMPWGGHAVLAGAYDSELEPGRSDVEVITWGERIGTTDSFLANHLEEAWVVILREHLEHPAFQEGIDLPGLADAFFALTGRELPVDLPEPEAEPRRRDRCAFFRWLTGLF